MTTDPSSTQAASDQPSDHPGGQQETTPRLPLSVWPTAQQLAARQRAGRYLPESTAHPAKMMPAIARHAIGAYTRPGDLVLDPMCGIGTTLVEAVHLGRDAVGIELEARWADIARRNLDLARGQGASGTGRVRQGDARHLPDLLDKDLRGRVTLVLTSPPYGRSRHGQVRARPGEGVTKWADTYTPSRRRGAAANLADASEQELVDGLVVILAGCRQVLRPGGLVVLTVRPWRRHDTLTDFPAAVAQAGQDAGLVLVERNVALLCGLRHGGLVPHPSFFQLDHVRKARRRGVPLRIIAHEDVLVLTTPPPPDRQGRGQAASAPATGPHHPTAPGRPPQRPTTRQPDSKERHD